MVAQAVESPVPHRQWENLTTPMTAMMTMDQPLSLVTRKRGKFEEIVEDHEEVVVQTLKRRQEASPERTNRVTFGGVRAVKRTLPNAYPQRTRGEVLREEKEKHQLGTGNTSKFQQQTGNSPQNLQQTGNSPKNQQQTGNSSKFQKKTEDSSRNQQQIKSASKYQNQIGKEPRNLTQEPVDLESKILFEIPKSDRGNKIHQDVAVSSGLQENLDNEETNQQPSEQNLPSVVPLSQDELDRLEREDASEGATTLLLLADGKQQYITLSPERAEAYPQFIGETQPNDEAGNHNPEGSRMMLNEPTYNEQLVENSLNSSGREKEDFSGDEDDPDGVLIVDLDESSSVIQHASENQEEDATDTVNSSEATITRDEIGNKQVNNGHCRSNNRFESKKKMEDGRLWLLGTFLVVAGSLSIVKLSDIEESYLEFCRKHGKEPLATPVLARLIHTLFPGAEKCRLGARGNQRIHYRNLKFRSAGPIRNQTSKLDNVNEDLPEKTVNQAEDTKGKKHDISESQKAQKESVIEICTDEQCEKNLPVGNGKSLQNQTETDDSPKKRENPADQGQDEEESCKAAAKKLSDVLKWISSQGENHKKALLRDFAHSASCQDVRCLPVCLMFRRIRRHVVAAKHCCSVLRLYSMLLRNHVSSCTSMECGLPACPALRATRVQKRSLDRDENPAKRAAVAQGQGLPRPSSIVLAPRSPGGSLPGSPVNSPPLSPELSPSDESPEWKLPSGQVQYLLLPVMMPVMKSQVA